MYPFDAVVEDTRLRMAMQCAVAQERPWAHRTNRPIRNNQAVSAYPRPRPANFLIAETQLRDPVHGRSTSDSDNRVGGALAPPTGEASSVVELHSRCTRTTQGWSYAALFRESPLCSQV